MYGKFFKRFSDILISLTALIVLSPVFLLLFILVRIALGGPVIYKQVRPGKDGKLFYIYKFRSMTNKKDAEGNLLPDEQRLTKFGKLLRKTSLDELPQLVNIFKGDMSLIGPRPRLVKDVVFYGTVKSLEVRPGMTGKSQVYGRNDNTWHQVFLHDMEYADNVSFFRDLKYFFLTFPALLRSRQSEKRVNKYYGDELLGNRLITQDQYEEGIALADKIVAAFEENGEQLLKEGIYKLYQKTLDVDPPKKKRRAARNTIID